MAHLEGANFNLARLEGADLRRAELDSKTDLTGAVLGSRTRLGDIHWGGVGSVDLTQFNWTPVTRLGDETSLTRGAKAEDYELAARAYRQLAAQLCAQGMSEVADRFSYRAQVTQRRVFRMQRQWGRWFGTWLLDAVSGHGYKPMRSIITYLLVVLGFATAYFAVTNFAIMPFLPTHTTSLAWYEALVLSISSFHGRGLFPSALTLGDPIAIFAAIEAIIGLLIEIRTCQ
jgi:Pentapeptide repeats (8 copies)